jgi:hypothetical protein
MRRGEKTEKEKMENGRRGGGRRILRKGRRKMYAYSYYTGAKKAEVLGFSLLVSFSNIYRLVIMRIFNNVCTSMYNNI